MKYFGKAKDMSITILSANTEDSSKRDQWLGFVQTIKVFMHNENLKIKGKIENSVEKLDKKLNSEIKIVKTELKTDIVELKHEIESAKGEILTEIRDMFNKSIL